MREINAKGLQIIKDSEGLYLERYLCPANVPTIGYGNTSHALEYETITEEQAEQFLKEDLEETQYQLAILTNKIPLTDNQWSALVSFVFNVGTMNFLHSTMRRKLQDGDYEGAANELDRWVYAKGVKLNGLIVRRQKEKELFLETD